MTPLHQHVLDRLDAYLEGTLSAEDAAAVRRHCRVCETCRAAFESLGGEPGGDRRGLVEALGDGAAVICPASGGRFWQAFSMACGGATSDLS